LKDNNKFNAEAFLNSYFYGIDEGTLIEMVSSFPDEFNSLCTLMCLEIQIEKETYAKKSNSYRRDLC
tara:strand:- start:971 stop:1171 length:201 start_codon:yes stop_codon:yes gene_type:complete